MSYLGSWKIDDALVFPAITHSPATGALTDADDVPAYRVYENEVGTAILTGSMAKLDDTNTTGFYSEQITLSAANGFEKGKCYTIYITAAVSSVTGGTYHTFQMEAEVDANTVSSIGANVITASAIADGAIDAAAIADGAIDAATFAAGAITATVIATGAIDADALATDAVAEIADGVWDEALAGHVAAGSAGEALGTAGAAGDPWATALPGAYGGGTAGNIVGNNLDAAVSLQATSVQAAAIKAKTDNLTFTSGTHVDANIQAVNDVEVQGAGSSGNEWRPV